MTKSIKFNGKDIIIELKDTFKALQNVKETEKIDDRNLKLRTLETPSISTKNGSFEPQIVNWAHNGLISEPFKELLNEFDSSESTGIFYRIDLLKIA